MQADQYIVLDAQTIRLARRSPRTKQVNVMNITCTPQQLEEYGKGVRMIQDCLPDATADQREFVKTGYTSQDWEAIFGPEPD